MVGSAVLVISDRVFSAAAPEAVCIGASAPIQGVIATFANQYIISIRTLQDIIPRRPHHQIRPRGAGEVVFSGRCDADCPTAEFFAESAYRGVVELRDHEPHRAPTHAGQPCFANRTDELNEVNDALLGVECNGLPESVLDRSEVLISLTAFNQYLREGAQTRFRDK